MDILNQLNDDPALLYELSDDQIRQAWEAAETNDVPLGGSLRSNLYGLFLALSANESPEAVPQAPETVG